MQSGIFNGLNSIYTSTALQLSNATLYLTEKGTHI